MLAAGNIFISMMSVGSLSLLYYKVRKPFKGHSFNTFAYIILLLIVYALIGNSIIHTHSFVVRTFYFLIDKDSLSPKMLGFVATYPCINLVICSYLLSNQW